MIDDHKFCIDYLFIFSSIVGLLMLTMMCVRVGECIGCSQYTMQHILLRSVSDCSIALYTPNPPHTFSYDLKWKLNYNLTYIWY